MPLFVFASVYVIPVLAVLGLTLGGLWTWATPVFVFGVLPLVELALPGTRANADAATESARRADPRFDLLLYGAVPTVFGLVVALAARASSFGGWELAGLVTSVGVVSGALGINVAHELGHRARKADQRVAKLLLLASLYMHFFVEHNRGHHSRVATPEDPASARRGESIYPYWVRTVVGGWRSAWALDRRALLGFLAAQAGFVTALALAFGPVGAGAFVGSAVVAILLLETVNYVEHYGLARARLPDGRYERVRPAHSWTSDRPLSRALLFELTRHADHHANPGRPYTVLRHFPEAPELPTGYAGMVLLALFPPAFMAVMDRHLETERARLSPA